MKRFFLILIAAIFCLPNEGFAQLPSYSETIDPSQSAMASTWFIGKYGGTESFNWNSKQKKANKGYVKVPRARNIYLAKITTDSVTNIKTARWEDGAIYIGEIYYAELKGKGTMNYPDGGKYIGDWSKDRRWGVGTMYYPNGDVYHGEWMWNVPEGQGTFITAEGVAFTGKFEDGIPRGKCIIQDVDGRKYKARWGWGTGKLLKHSIRPLKKKK